MDASSFFGGGPPQQQQYQQQGQQQYPPSQQGQQQQMYSSSTKASATGAMTGTPGGGGGVDSSQFFNDTNFHQQHHGGPQQQMASASSFFGNHHQQLQQPSSSQQPAAMVGGPVIGGQTHFQQQQQHHHRAGSTMSHNSVNSGEFETLDINNNEDVGGGNYDGGGGSASASDFFGGGQQQQQQQGNANDFFGGNQSSSSRNTTTASVTTTGGAQQQQQQQQQQQFQASSGPENFSTLATSDGGGGGQQQQFQASSGPENFSMPPSTTTTNNNGGAQTEGERGGEFEYEGVALQTAISTFASAASLASRGLSGVGGVVANRVTPRKAGDSVGGGGVNVVAGSAVKSVASGMGSMMKGIGNFASNIVGGDDEIAEAMQQWAEAERMKQQQQQGQGGGQQQQQGGGAGGSGGGGGMMNRMDSLPQESYLQQEVEQQQQYAPQQQQQNQPPPSNTATTTAHQIFNAPSPASTPQFGAANATTTTTASNNAFPPAMSLGTPAVPSSSTAAMPTTTTMMNSNNNQGGMQQQQYWQQQQQQQQSTTMDNGGMQQQYPATTGVSANNIVSRMASEASSSSAAEVFGSGAGVTPSIGGGVATTMNSSAEDVFGNTSVAATTTGDNVSASDVFGASNVAPTNNETASAADVFGSTAAVAAANENVSAADVFGPTSAEEVFGGVADDSTATPAVEESNVGIEVEPVEQEDVHAVNDFASTEVMNNQPSPPQQQHPFVERQSSNQLSSLECAEHDPNFQYSDPLVGSDSNGLNNSAGIAKPPATGNVLAMEIGNYHPPTAMMDQQQGMDISIASGVGMGAAASANENVVEPPNGAVEVVTEEKLSTVDTPETAEVMFGGASIAAHHQSPPVETSPNVSTITSSSPAESTTEKHTIESSLSSLAAEKRPTVATTNVKSRRFQLNLPQKANLPLPPPRNKKTTSSSVSGGGSSIGGGSIGIKKKLGGSSPFKKPPPMEVSATPRFHVPSPHTGGSSVGSGGSHSRHHYNLPKTATALSTPGATSVLTTSPLPTPRVLADDNDNGDALPPSSPLLPAASTAAATATVKSMESEAESALLNATPSTPIVTDDADKMAAEGEGTNATADAPSSTADAKPEAPSFQPLELEDIVEAVATATEEFKMELPKKEEITYSGGTVGAISNDNGANEGMMQNENAAVGSGATSSDVPPPTYSLTTRPNYHEDNVPKAESSLYTEGDTSDYQSSLRDEDLPPIMSSETKEENEVEDGGDMMLPSDEHQMIDHQEQIVTEEEDFVVVDSNDVANNDIMSSTDIATPSPASSPWVETLDPVTHQTYYFNRATGETSWHLPTEDEGNDVAVSQEEVEESNNSPEKAAIESGAVESVEISEDVGVNESPVVEEAAEIRVITEDEAPILPEGWVKSTDDASGKTYYYNTTTGESSWDLPPADRFNPEGSVDVHPEVEVANHEEEDLAAQVTADQIDSAAEGVNDSKTVPVPEVGPLPAGWMEANDPSGKVFYFNSLTGESCWERPNVIVEAAGNLDDPTLPDVVATGDEDEHPTVDSGACEVVDDTQANTSVEIENVAVVDEAPPIDDNAENLSFESLPPGWIESKDPTSGQIYYYNEVSGDTSWSRPTVEKADDVQEESGNSVDDAATEEEHVVATSIPQAEVDEANGELQQPAVIEATEDASNLDEAMGPTTAAEVVSEALPVGWMASIDETTGKTFYYNEETGESTWDAPQMEVAADDFVPTGEGPIEGDEAEGSELIETEEVVNDAAKEVVEESPSPSHEEVTVTEDELPAGWMSSVDETTGKMFYYNEETGESSWDKPRVDVVDKDEAPAVIESNTDVQETTEELVDEAEEINEEANVTEGGQEPVGEHDSDPRAAHSELPPGWAEAEYEGKPYFYNEETGETSWERPSVENISQEQNDASGDTELVAGERVDDTAAPQGVEDSAVEAPLDEVLEELHDNDVAESPTVLDVAKVEDPAVMDEATEPAAAFNDEAMGPTTAAEVVSEALPVGWMASIDETTGKTFYYNEETGESTWKAPQMEVAAEDVSKVEGPIEGDEAEESELIETEEVADDVVDEVVEESPSREEGIAEDELPAGWMSSVDETTGKTFYYNEETGESSWERPNVKVEVVDDVSKDEDTVVIETDAYVQEQETGEEPAEEAEEVITEEEVTATEKPPQNGELPPGWAEAEYEGNIYYYNEATGETSWERPSAEKSDEDQIENVPTGDTPVAADDDDGVNMPEESSANEVVEEPTALALDGAEEEEPTILDEADEPTAADEVKMEKVLPSGWKEVKDEATQNTYYWNEVTNETSWDYPQEVIAASDDVANVDTEKEEDKNDQVDLGVDNGHGTGAADVHENDQSTDILPLPEGWLEAVDETTGSTYFYNEKTNETSWDRPVSIPNTKLKREPDTSKAAQRCRPAHAIATFGFGGRLCVMIPQVATSLSGATSQTSSSDQPTMRRGPVVIHRVKELIPIDHKFSIPSTPAFAAVAPLIKAKEDDVFSFLKQKCASPENLIWSVINIAAQNRGRLKNSDDVVDGGPEGAIVDLLLSLETASTHPNNVPSRPSSDADLNDVQYLLLRGERELAAAKALEDKHYALALIIASMCDEGTYEMVAQRFADDALSSGSPLYTTALLFTNNLRLPPSRELKDPGHQSSFWCTDVYRDLETNWKQQLASILSNQRDSSTKIIMTLGDRLMQVGLCQAAHVCYLAASMPLNDPSKPTTRMTLLGCDHKIPINRALMTPGAIEAFERSEAFEWARRLGNKKSTFSSLQPFKLRYAELLADFGHEELAREYLLSIRLCTGIGLDKKALSFDSSFIQLLRELDDRICGSVGAERSSWDVNDKSSNGSMFSLGRLSALVRGKETENQEVVETPRLEGEVDPLDTPPAEADPSDGKMKPVALSFTNAEEESTKQTNDFDTSIGVVNDTKQESIIDDDATPASAPASLAIGESIVDQAEETNRQGEKDDAATKTSTSSEAAKRDGKKAAPVSEPPVSAGLLRRLFGVKESKAKVADVGDAMEAYYDQKLKRWVFPGDDVTEMAKPLAPPPIIPSDNAPSTPAPTPAPSNDPLAALMAPPTRATTGRKALPPRYTDPLSSMGNVSAPSSALKKDVATPTIPKFAVFQPIPAKADPSKDEKENVSTE